MKWFDDADADDKRRRRRIDAIHRGADTIYQNLWDEIVRQVAYIAEQGREISTNGSPLDRIITVSERVKSRECHLLLDAKREAITATGGGVDLTFALDVADDNVICLKRGSEEMDLLEAAEAILHPLLFPDKG
jgi:hypothetical protein